MDEKENVHPQDEPNTEGNLPPVEPASVDTADIADLAPTSSVDMADEIPAQTTTSTAGTQTNNNRSVYFFAGIAIVVLALAGVAYLQFGPDKAEMLEAETGELTDKQSSEAVAYVNGVAISRGALEESATQLSQGAAQNGMDLNDMVVKAQIETQAYEITINNELLRQAASASVDRPSDEVVQKEIDTLITQNGGQEAFDGLLIQYKLTLETLKKNIADNLHIQAYLDTKITPVEVSDADVQAFYDSLGGEEAGIPPLAEVKDQVIAEIKNQKEQEQIAVILEGLKAEAKIEKV